VRGARAHTLAAWLLTELTELSIERQPVRQRAEITLPEGGSVKYLALIYSDEGAWEALSDDERTQFYADYLAFSEAGRKAGVVLGGDELEPVRNATTVRLRDQQTVVSDGPYAETKEALGGYYLLECASLEEAVEWAARIPGAAHGAVEVRQVHVDEDEEPAAADERVEVAS
jgi:hypothetical protein